MRDLSLGFECDVAAVNTENVPRRFVERVVLAQPRTEERVELVARHRGIEIDAIDLLRRDESELGQERGSAIRRRLRIGALRIEVLAILGERNDRRVAIEAAPRGEPREHVTATR